MLARLPKIIALAIVVMAALVNVAPGTPAGGQSAIVWPQLAVVPVAGGLVKPTTIRSAGDGSGRLFVTEQIGRIRVIENSALVATPFLDIIDRVGSSSSEQGLLGLAFSPNYQTNGVFYVNYTNKAGDTVIGRYRVSDDPNVALRAEENVLTIDQPYANHNGGDIAFGPDGYLYIGMGDGGAGGDPENRAQNPAELLGKMLRIDPETGSPRTYTVPADNPFIGRPGYRAEIWALGVRNPWRFSFDRENGDLWIGDVGQSRAEEISRQPAGAGGLNFGWKIMEGVQCYNATTCTTAGLTPPVLEYTHGLGCSVTGGYVYRGSEFPRMSGAYLYADFCSGRVWGIRPNGSGWANQQLIDLTFNVSTFGEDESGRLYLAAHGVLGGDTIYRLIDSGAVATPTPVTPGEIKGRAFLPIANDLRSIR